MIIHSLIFIDNTSTDEAKTPTKTQSGMYYACTSTVNCSLFNCIVLFSIGTCSTDTEVSSNSSSQGMAN